MKTNTSLAVESGGGRQGLRTEVSEALKPPAKRGGGVGEDGVAEEAAVHGHSEALPQPELQASRLALPQIAPLYPRRRHWSHSRERKWCRERERRIPQRYLD